MCCDVVKFTLWRMKTCASLYPGDVQLTDASSPAHTSADTCAQASGPPSGSPRGHSGAGCPSLFLPAPDAPPTTTAPDVSDLSVWLGIKAGGGGGAHQREKNLNCPLHVILLLLPE